MSELTSEAQKIQNPFDKLTDLNILITKSQHSPNYNLQMKERTVGNK